MEAEFLPLMKTFISTVAVALLLLLPAGAAEPQKPLVTLSVKRQTLDSEHDLRGRQGDTRQKTIALRVELANTSSAPINESELSGDALVTRAGDTREMVNKESLGAIKVPAMKPGERLTLDLGKIQLSEIEWRNRKFEETLEEWKVTCTLGKVEIGKAVSSQHYETLLKDVVPETRKAGRAKPFRNPRR